MKLHEGLYELAGGEMTFRLLVQRFYARVAGDPALRAVYPEEDLSGATERLTLFLIQYWGGPNTYSEQRGHPRLRMRHNPFAIGQRERDADCRRNAEWLVERLGRVGLKGEVVEVVAGQPVLGVAGSPNRNGGLHL